VNIGTEQSSMIAGSGTAKSVGDNPRPIVGPGDVLKILGSQPDQRSAAVTHRWAGFTVEIGPD
jgi:hypothetical protein